MLSGADTDKVCTRCRRLRSVSEPESEEALPGSGEKGAGGEEGDEDGGGG